MGPQNPAIWRERTIDHIYHLVGIPSGALAIAFPLMEDHSMDSNNAKLVPTTPAPESEEERA
jgi:hypothetical protein